MKTSLSVKWRTILRFKVAVVLFLFLAVGVALAQDVDATCQSLGLDASLTSSVTSGEQSANNGELFVGISVNAAGDELSWSSYNLANAEDGPDGIPVGAVLITGSDGLVMQYDYSPAATYAGGLIAPSYDAIAEATFCGSCGCARGSTF